MKKINMKNFLKAVVVLAVALVFMLPGSAVIAGIKSGNMLEGTRVDITPPVTNCTLDPEIPDGDNGWYVSAVTVTLTATDEESGVASTWYCLDGGYWWIYINNPFVVSGEGYHTVEYYSFDGAGNKEDTKEVEFKIDTNPPVTTHEFDGMMVEGCFVTTVTITLSAHDVTSDVNYTTYKIDDGIWTNYTEPVNVTEDGEYILSYYSVDLAGNVEPTSDVDFKIEQDLIPPVTTHKFDGTIGNNDWYTGNVVITLTAEDDSAGVDYTMYKLDDDTEWQNYTYSFLVTEDGERMITYYSVDKVGNKENDSDPFGFKIDQTNPTIELTWDEENSKLVADVDAEPSGVAKVEFYVNGVSVGEVTEAPYEWEVSDPQSGDVGQVIVYDNAGNRGTSEEIDAVSQSQSQSSSSTPLSFQILSWLFGLW